MASLFTKIINREIPCHKILENERYLAFLDIRPINPGHTLVIPKEEIDYIFDIDDAMIGGMMIFAKKVAGLIQQEVECERIGMMVAGLEVPHAHIHLVPLYKISDLNFANAKPASEEDLAEMAKNIHAYALEQ